MRIYLAGPMRGYPAYNFPAFHAAAAALRAKGHEVWSPAENDVEIDNFDPAKDAPREMKHYMERDLPAVCASDAVAVLPGWEKSEGAQLEVHVARQCKIPVLLADTLEPVQSELPEGEIRMTDPNTGGQKGVKLARFDLIPAEPLWELAETYGRGAKKYADDNWRKGYDWRLSFGAMMRHAWKFWLGHQRDEDGNHHLAQVAWHAFTMLWFERYDKGTDSRYTSKEAA